MTKHEHIAADNAAVDTENARKMAEDFERLKIENASLKADV